MAKSKIIKELANGAIDTMTALKRAKVLFSELGNKELINWVNYELTGYPTDVELPDYRAERGNIIGTYIVGTMRTHAKYTNVSIPLGKMPQEFQDDILCINLRDSVAALKQLSEKQALEKSELGKLVPADYYPIIAKYNNNPYMSIATAKVIIGTQCIANVLAMVENRLLDALILLEREFGNLDELDIDTSSKTADELKEIVKQICVLVYNDQSITIGNGNKINNTDVASVLQK